MRAVIIDLFFFNSWRSQIMIRRRKIYTFWRFILICQKWDRLRCQSCDYLSASQSLPSVTEVWPSAISLEYCGFLLYRTEPSVKKVEVVDCDFIAVPQIITVTPSCIFYTITDLERSVVIPQSTSSSVIWKTMIFENQIPHVKLMSTYITWKPVRQPFTNIHCPLSHARFPFHHLNTSLF